VHILVLFKAGLSAVVPRLNQAQQVEVPREYAICSRAGIRIAQLQEESDRLHVLIPIGKKGSAKMAWIAQRSSSLI
jgi:hypothetical protein